MAVDTGPLGPDDLTYLATLFQTERTTRHCWCTAFCTTRGQFAVGWLNGGNRRRFETMATGQPTPMGILASVEDEPVGWCACGPRSRYTPAISGRSSLIAGRPRTEDEQVWLVACLFVRPGHRRTGITYPLLRAAVALARREGALAIEAWPLAATVRRSSEAFVGQEAVFEHLGFSCIERPTPDRVIMRLDFVT